MTPIYPFIGAKFTATQMSPTENTNHANYRCSSISWVTKITYLSLSSTKSILVPITCIRAFGSMRILTPLSSTISSNFPFSSEHQTQKSKSVKRILYVPSNSLQLPFPILVAFKWIALNARTARKLLVLHFLFCIEHSVHSKAIYHRCVSIWTNFSPCILLQSL